MKPRRSVLPLLFLLHASLLWGGAGITEVNAQEENLQRALADQDRRIAGLTAMATRVKSLVAKFVPGVEFEEEEEGLTDPPATSPQLTVTEVKLIETQAATEEAVSAAAEQAAVEEATYRTKLQAAASKLKIQGAFPQSKQVMIGAQNLGVGEKLSIQLGEDLFDLEILDITASNLKLRDRHSQLELDVAIGVTSALPPGMFRKPPPGMLPTVAPRAEGG